MTRKEKENENIKALIVETLIETGKEMTITELIADEWLNGYTSQRIFILLRQMIVAGKVIQMIKDKKVYFTLK